MYYLIIIFILFTEVMMFRRLMYYKSIQLKRLRKQKKIYVQIAMDNVRRLLVSGSTGKSEDIKFELNYHVLDSFKQSYNQYSIFALGSTRLVNTILNEQREMIDNDFEDFRKGIQLHFQTRFNLLYVQNEHIIYQQLGMQIYQNSRNENRSRESSPIKKQKLTISKSQNSAEFCNIDDVNEVCRIAKQMNDTLDKLGFKKIEASSNTLYFEIWTSNPLNLPKQNRHTGPCPVCKLNMKHGEEMFRHIEKFHGILKCYYDESRTDLILPLIADNREFLIKRVLEVTKQPENEIENHIFKIHPRQIKYNYIPSGNKREPFYKF